jgi:hypothetical protein
VSERALYGHGVLGAAPRQRTSQGLRSNGDSVVNRSFAFEGGEEPHGLLIDATPQLCRRAQFVIGCAVGGSPTAPRREP